MVAFRPESFIFLACLSVSIASCGPTTQLKQTQSTTPATTTLASSQTSTSKQAATTNAPKSSTSSLASAASVSSGSPSFVRLRSGDDNKPMQSSLAADLSNTADAFDGKNPFADDSLWQIPVHLVRDFNSANDDSLAKSASETNSASESSNSDDGDIESLDEPEAPASSNGYTQSTSSSPTIISASTDLKTAAGYHYPSSHGHHGYGGHSPSYGAHHGSHYAGSHHGDHYGGKYFQYASVPYPYAWDFGYKRGNPYHTIERYEHGKGPHFQTKVKWSDKHGGYGVHVWDYNHDDHHSHHYGGDHHGGYESHGPSHYGSGAHSAGHYGHH